MLDAHKLLAEYEEAAQTLERQWGDIKAIISGGFAPSDGCAGNFLQSMKRLQMSYDAIQRAAKEIAPEKTKDGYSAQIYAEMIEQQQRENNDREKNRNMLERFITVKAVSESLAVALAPYQKSAVALLEQTEPVTEDDLAGPSLFLSCLEMESLDSQKGEALLERLTEIYPIKVYNGVIFKKYFIPGESPTAEGFLNVKTLHPIQPMRTDNTETTLTAQEAPSQEVAADEHQKKEMDTELEKPAGDKSESTVLISAIRPIKDAAPTAAAFKSDVMRISAARVILPLFTHLGALTESQILAFGIIMDAFKEDNTLAQSTHAALKKLVDKNMLAVYELNNDQEHIYCLTPYCCGCMQKNTIKNNRTIWNINCGKVCLRGQQEMDAGVLACFQINNAKLLTYLNWAKDTYSTLVYRRIRGSVSWLNDHYIMSVLWKDESFSCSMQTDLKDVLPEENILWVMDTARTTAMQRKTIQSEHSEERSPAQPKTLPDKGDLFCIWDSVLYRWAGERWITEKDEENEPSDEYSIQKHPDEDIPSSSTDFNVQVETKDLSVQDDDHTELQKVDGMKNDPPEMSLTKMNQSLEQSEEIDIAAYDAQENARRLLKQKDSIRLESLLKLTVRLIAEDRIAEASTLAEALAKAPGATKTMEHFYRTFCQSVQFPGSIYHYSSDVINDLQSVLPENDQDLRSLQQTMVLATLLWAMAFPSTAYDHSLYNNARMAVGTTENQTIQNLVTLLSEDLKDISFKNDGLGFSPAIISMLVDSGERKQQIASLCRQASDLKRTPTSTINITGLEACLKRLVGPASKIGDALLRIEKGNTENAATIRAGLEKELGADFLTSDAALESYIDRCWNSLRKTDSHVKVKRLDNDTPARKACKKALTDRIAVIRNWLYSVQTTPDSALQQYRDGYARIVNKLRPLLNEMAEHTTLPKQPYEAAGQLILRRTAKKILLVLTGTPSVENDRFFMPLCLTPELMLEKNGENLIVSELYSVPGLEPWSFVLRAIAAGPEKPQDILMQIDDYCSERWYRNYGSEALLYAYTGEKCPDRTLPIQNAQKEAEQSVQIFKSNARLNRAYGKIQEHEMETAFSVLDLAQKIYFKSHNYASFKCFLKQLNGVLNREIKMRAIHYEKQVRELEDTFAGTEMFDAIHRALENRNFNSVDSYINQLQSGVTELPESDRSMEQKTNFLKQFQDCEEGYFNACQDRSHRSQNPARWGEQTLDAMASKYRHWTSPNEKKKGRSWLASWIMRKDDSSSGIRVQNILSGLGFRVKSTPSRDNSFPRTAMYEVFQVSAEKTSPMLKDYSHPIYKFGTDLSDPMYVVCLYGCKGASTLINVMTGELQLSGSTIVLMDGSLTVEDRHLVAAKFKADTSGQSPFLLIDRVLLLYLASLDEGDRQKAMLCCTLPYTFEVLYGSGSGAVPEEMFIGRVSEMNDLRNEQGPSLVYGGRQLGKTALLSRASKTIHNPKKQEYSFCVDVKDEGSTALLEKVNRSLQRLGLLEEPCSTLKSLCDNLQRAYEDKKIHRLQIFVDEVDKLFEEFGQTDFKELRPFILLRDATGHHVKFVFVGTHNVAATDKADMNNSNIVHMGRPLCIEPLSTGDAVKLIRVPMSYLGFEIGDSQIELILSNTNSYPGLIHMFCNALIQSVCRDYETYYSTGQAKENPPYRISDEQMRAVFKEKDIRKEIGTRVMATIKLNQKYNVISALLAHMIYEDRECEHNRLYGYSAQELLDYNRKEFQIHMLDKMVEKDMEALLDEMVHMGILWKTPMTQQFRFRQQDFLNYIGSSDQVIELLLSESTEDGV